MSTLHGIAHIPSLLDELAATPQRLADLVTGTADEYLDRASHGEWSARTVIAHLRDDEFMVMRLRLERMLVENEPDLAPFDEKVWAATRYTGRDSLDELLADLRLHREASLSILRRLEPAHWIRTGRQPEYGAFDIHWWLQHWTKHDNVHLAQIRDALGTR